MIVSHEWLKQFVPHTHNAQEIGDLLSRHCVTLDNIEHTARINGVIANGRWLDRAALDELLEKARRAANPEPARRIVQ